MRLAKNKYSPPKTINFLKMHILQPKHSKLKAEEAKKLLQELNVSLSQLPKIKFDDSALPKDIQPGDVIKIERKFNEKTVNSYRVAI